MVVTPGILAQNIAPEQDTRPPLLREVGIDQKLNTQVPLDLSFRDDEGRSVRLGDYFGKKPVVMALVYYDCPMLCTQVLNGLASALQVLKFDAGREFNLVLVSIDPKETPQLAAAKKKSYLERYQRSGAAAGWHFLTGEQTAIEQLAQAVGFRYVYDPKTGQYAHAAAIMVLTPEGKIAQYYYGIEYPPRDLRLGLVEASKDHIGSVADRVLLYCYHYDPAKGRYGAVAMNVLRLAGVATVLVLGTFIFLSLRRDFAQPRMRAGG
ncbi:MAG: SCO family protein [Terriglobales bacterium]